MLTHGAQSVACEILLMVARRGGSYTTIQSVTVRIVRRLVYAVGVSLVVLVVSLSPPPRRPGAAVRPGSYTMLLGRQDAMFIIVRTTDDRMRASSFGVALACYCPGYCRV